jgi:hypothetical protein
LRYVDNYPRSSGNAIVSSNRKNGNQCAASIPPKLYIVIVVLSSANVIDCGNRISIFSIRFASRNMETSIAIRIICAVVFQPNINIVRSVVIVNQLNRESQLVRSCATKKNAPNARNNNAVLF